MLSQLQALVFRKLQTKAAKDTEKSLIYLLVEPSHLIMSEDHHSLDVLNIIICTKVCRLTMGYDNVSDIKDIVGILLKSTSNSYSKSHS